MCLLLCVPREIPACSTPCTFPLHTRVFSVIEYLFAEHYWQTTVMLSVDLEPPPPLPLVRGDRLRAGEKPSRSLPKQEDSEGRLAGRCCHGVPRAKHRG